MDTYPNSQYRNTGWGVCSGLLTQGRLQAQMEWREGCSKNAQISSLQSSQRSSTCPCYQSPSHPATIIPLPKKTVISGLNDYRPVVLTPVIMKCSETLVQQHIKASLPVTFDPHQFAYRTNRSTEDTIATALHTALLHLEHQGSYVRMLLNWLRFSV